MGLCGCGRTLSVFDDACAACGAANVPKRLPLRRHPWVRAARWSALAAAAGAAAWFVLAPRDVPAWQLRADAADACAAARFDDAVEICRRLTAGHPDDAEGWLLLAQSCRGAGQPPDAYVPAAERALAADPRLAAAHVFLARAELLRGRLTSAVGHAAAATRISPDDGDAWLLSAELEMRKPRPDLARVRDALERAQAGGRETREAQILLADVSIRLNGAVGTGADRLSASAATALRRALAALDANRGEERDPLAAGTSRARILLALGEPDDAFAAAEAALARVRPDTPPAATAEVRLLRAMALHSRGNRADALRAFAEVLRDRADASSASAASAYLLASDDAPAACELLAHAAATADPTGGVHAVLATTLLEKGDLDGAWRAIEAACASSPADPFLAEIRGTVREAQGRFDDARAAYSDAVRLGESLVGPRVRLALLTLAETPPAAAGPGAYDAALADLEGLRARFDDDPLLLEGLGRLRLARGDVTAARTALEAAARSWPSEPDVWIALAEARRRSGGPSPLDDAADALAHARRLRPGDSTIARSEARTWIDAGKPDVAAAACTEHLRRRPGDAAVLRLRAGAYRRLRMWSLAAADLRRVRELGAAADEDLAELSLALALAGDAPHALRLVDEVRAAADPAGMLDRVAALAPGDAEAAIRPLADAGPSLLLASAQLAAGRADDALACLRALQRTRPGDPYVARMFVAAALAPQSPRPEDVAEARAMAASVTADAPAGLRDLAEGRVLVAAGRPGEAAVRLRAAVAARPDDPFASLFLGEALCAGRHRDDGLASVRRAVALAAAGPAVHAAAARCILAASAESQDPASAEALAREAASLDRTLVAAAYRARSLLHARGDFARAADVAERALGPPAPAQEDALRLRFAAAADCRLDGDTAAAQAHADVLPPAARDSVPATLLRGLADLDAGRVDDADRLFASVLAADAENADAAAGLVLTSLRRGDRDPALARLAAWIAAHPDDRDVSLAAAGEMIRLGLTDDAVRVAAACASRHPRDIAAARLRAQALESAGDALAAVTSLATFAADASGDDAPDARLAAASVGARRGIGADAALADARRAAADTAASPYVRMLARAVEAEVLLATGRTHDAESAARYAVAAAERAPERGRPERRVEARARYVLALAAASAAPARRDEALAEMSRCTELDPADLEMADGLARLLAESDDTAQRALAVARRVTATAPGEPRYRETLAEAACRAGRLDDARAAWTRALEMLAAAHPPAPERRARTALRFARFLREHDDPAAARRVAEDARRAAQGTDAAKDLARFLAE